MINWNIFLFAFLGGIIPAVVWLIFWLMEDYKRPEPKRLILRAFFLGMIAVILVLPFQQSVDTIFPGLGLVAFLLWSILEEGFKLGAAYFGGMQSPEDDEPIDPLIYMITAALGFTALENTLFIISPLLDNNHAMGVVAGNMRFVGASLLHTFTAGIIGIGIGLSFYKRNFLKFLYILTAFILAVAFHTAFNLTISHNPLVGTTYAFSAVWIGIAITILSFERLKTIAREN